MNFKVPYSALLLFFFSNTVALSIVPCGKLHLDRSCRLWGKSQEWVLAGWVSNSVGLGWWRSFICCLVPGLGLWVLSADKNQGQPRVCVFTAELFNLAHPRVYLVFSMSSASILNLFCFKLWIFPFRVVCLCVCVTETEREERFNFFPSGKCSSKIIGYGKNIHKNRIYPVTLLCRNTHC